MEIKMQPEIYAKAALSEDNILTKENIGCDGIEIQLLDELVNKKLGSYHYAEEVFDLDKLLKHNIKAVYAPLLSHFGLSDVNIESLCDSEDFMLLDQVCYIANKAGEINNRQVIVIIHSESSHEIMKLIGDTWKRVLNSIGCLLFKYPRIEIAIENVTPLRECSKGILHLANNFYNDNITMAIELRKQLNTDRIGTVLDTCHAEISKRFYESLLPNYYEVLPTIDFSMDSFFKNNKDIVKLFHFSNTVGDGCGTGKHGQPFSEDSYKTLVKYLDLYHKYNIIAPITLEVAETDYLVSDGYKESYRLVNKYYNTIIK